MVRSPRPPRRELEGPAVEPVSGEQARQAREALAEAQRALATNDARTAIDNALRAERSDRSLNTHSVLARAYCILGDLGNARPEYEQAARSERRTIKSFCAKHGVELIEQ